MTPQPMTAATEASPSPRPTPAPPITRPPQPRQRRRGLLLPVLAACAIGLLILAALVLYPRLIATTGPAPAAAPATPGAAAVGPTTQPATGGATPGAPALVTAGPASGAASKPGSVLTAPTSTTVPAATNTPAATATPGAAARLDQARRLLDQGQLDQAIPLLEAIQQQDPSTPGLPETLVRGYDARGQDALAHDNLDASQAAFDKALALRGDDEAAQTGRKRISARRAWGQVDANWGKDDDAVLAALETVRRDDPEYRAADVRDKLYVVRLGRADNLLKSGNPDGAAEELTRAVEVDPNRPEAKERLVALTPTPVPPTATPRPAVVPQQQAPVQRPPVQQAPAPAAPAQAAPAQQAPAPAPRTTRPPPASGNPLE